MTSKRKNRHIVLLGDSIFDNAAYVPGGLSVIEHLRQTIPPDWSATLLAVDGSVTSSVSDQIAGIPANATCLVISAGGNDALQNIDVFNEPVTTVGEALQHLAGIRSNFQREYHKMLTHMLAINLSTTQWLPVHVAVCTIYNTVPGLGDMEKTALALFNEIILLEASMAKVPVIDLRIVCDDANDYSPLSPIEPSHEGGVKIASAIYRVSAYLHPDLSYQEQVHCMGEWLKTLNPSLAERLKQDKRQQELDKLSGKKLTAEEAAERKVEEDNQMSPLGKYVRMRTQQEEMDKLSGKILTAKEINERKAETDKVFVEHRKWLRRF